MSAKTGCVSLCLRSKEAFPISQPTEFLETSSEDLLLSSEAATHPYANASWD